MCNELNFTFESIFNGGYFKCLQHGNIELSPKPPPEGTDVDTELAVRFITSQLREAHWFLSCPTCHIVQLSTECTTTRAVDMREPLCVLKKRLLSGLLTPCVSVAPERGPKVMPLHGIVLMTHPIL